MTKFVVLSLFVLNEITIAYLYLYNLILWKIDVKANQEKSFLTLIFRFSK